jgi:hypothetical protein
MAYDKKGTVIHVGDRVRVNGKEHVVNGMAGAPGIVGAESIGHAKFVAFAADVEAIEKHEKNVGAQAFAALASDQSIVWGNGQ